MKKIKRRKVRPVSMPKSGFNFMGTSPNKKMNFMRVAPKRRPKNEFNRAPLKGLNILNVHSKNIFNISPNAKPKKFKHINQQFFKKESTTQSKALSKWGDADMDGTVNFLDCSPRNVANDGFFGDMVSKVKGAFSKDKDSGEGKSNWDKKSQEDKEIQRAEWDKAKLEGKAEILRDKIAEKAEAKAIATEHENIASQAKSKKVVISDKAMGDIRREQLARDIITEHETGEKVPVYKDEKGGLVGSAKRGIDSAQKVIEKSNEEYRARTQPKRDKAEAYRNRPQYVKDAENLKKSKNRKRVLTAIGGSALALVGTNPSQISASWRTNKYGSYSKHNLEGQKRAGRKVANTVQAFLPDGERLVGARRPYGTSTQKNSPQKHRKPGRPKGTVRHVIPGVPGFVSGERYKEWAKEQKGKIKKQEGGGKISPEEYAPQMQRAVPKLMVPTANEKRSGVIRIENNNQMVSMQRSAPLISQEVRVMTAKPMEATPRTVNQNMQPAEMQVMTAKPMTSNVQAVTQPVQRMPSDQREYEVKMRQMELQYNDNVLDAEKLEAPNIMKGEMVNTGDGKGILNAPNIMQGGMRKIYVDYDDNVTIKSNNMMKGDMERQHEPDEPGRGVKRLGLGERPQANEFGPRRGSEYTDIEIMSGKELIQSRRSEAWLTGDAK